MWRFLGLLVAIGLGVWLGQLVVRGGHAPAAPSWRNPTAAGENCRTAPAFAAAAQANAQSLASAPWSVFGRPETGWQIYAPDIDNELATDCPAWSEAFAAKLAGWQRSHALAPSGAMDAITLRALDVVWLQRRPFWRATAHGACPAPPPPANLVTVAPDEGLWSKPVQLRPGTLAAYRRMVAAARADVPAVAADHRLLAIFSGYRDPASDAARCAVELNCGTAVRATCSAHRTGLAMDIYLGAAPGYAPDSSDDANRLFQSRQPAYLWMVANAARFGFVNYPFEPWHWEWTGEPP
jgi:hypothetical protein